MTPAMFIVGWVITLVVVAIFAIIVIGIISYFVGIYNNLVTL